MRGAGGGHGQPFGLQLHPEPDAGRTEDDADRHGAQRRDGLDAEVHMAGDDDEGEPDGHHTEHRGGLDDVGEDAGLEVVRHEQGKCSQHEQQHEPGKVIEDELEGAAGVGVH